MQTEGDTMTWFSQRSVWFKLMATYLAIAVVTGIAGFVGMRSLGSLNEMLSGMYEHDLRGVAASNDIRFGTTRITRSVLQALDSTDPAALQATEAEIALQDVAIRAAMKPIEQDHPEDKAILDAIKTHCAKLHTDATGAVAHQSGGRADEAQALAAQLLTLDAEIGKASQELVAAMMGDAELAFQEGNATFAFARTLQIGLVGIGVALSFGLGYLVSRWFTRAIEEVDAISASVASASQQLAAAGEQLSSSSQQSASSLEETASSLEEITATVRQNADNADQANQLANTSRETAEKGGSVVAQAVGAMSEINKSSRKIADIITTIDEIAFQTNLLALNAAVEAARAGEQGRGFAVVAGEVRNLAQRSATAAREIKGLIEDSVQKVETGSELVNKSGETLGAIVSSVKRVTDIVAEIAAASREQTSGIEQINKAVAQMDQSTQATAAQMEELSGTATSLFSQSEQLQAVVEQFNLNRGAEPSAQKSRCSTPRAKTLNRQPAKAARRPSTPTKSASRRGEELELVGAGVGGDGFEEF